MPSLKIGWVGLTWSMAILPTETIMNNDNIITNRDELQDHLIKNILDDMDLKTMEALLYDMLNETYDKYSMNELIEEVEDYYPELLEEDPLANISELEATAPDYGVGK